MSTKFYEYNRCNLQGNLRVNFLFLYPIVGGFGLGAFIFNQIQTAYLNPINKELDDGRYFTDDTILNRVPSVFLMLGSVYSIVQVRNFDQKYV